jgi:Major Facilitator Superfamily
MTPRDQRFTLAAATLGSFVALLDSTVVGIALPAIGDELGGGLESQQWIVNAYLLTLGSLILIGGSLGDVFGERRVFVLGAAGFGVASAHCSHPRRWRSSSLPSHRTNGARRSVPGRRSAGSRRSWGRWSAAGWSTAWAGGGSS